MTIKQDQLVRYDQSLHEAEIKAKYAKEECLIQEKEIIRLNTVQEEHEEKIKKLQEDLIKLQEDVSCSIVFFFSNVRHPRSSVERDAQCSMRTFRC